MLWFRRLLVGAVAVSLASSKAPVSKQTLITPGVRLASPDGSFILLGKQGPSLWLRSQKTHQQLFVLSSDDPLAASWSPDGAFFAVNDRIASDLSRAYIYETNTLHRRDLAEEIARTFPDDKRFFQRAHSYISVQGWLDKHDALASLTGHTDDPPVTRFDLEFRVGAGPIRALSKKIGPDGRTTAPPSHPF